MTRVLILDLDQDHANALAAALTKYNYVSTVVTPRNLDTRFEEEIRNYDLVILDLTANRPDDWVLLQRICRWTAIGIPKPLVLCVSQRYWGPRMRLDVERWGGRLVYER